MVGGGETLQNGEIYAHVCLVSKATKILMLFDACTIIRNGTDGR